MDVVRIRTITRRALARFDGYRALTASLLILGGCDDSETTLILRQDPVGRLELDLIGRGSRGTSFRLRDALVTVQGPDQTLFFDSEDDPDATSFKAVLPPGSYSSFLQEGWRLERVDTEKTMADAVLLSPNPDFFEVFAGEQTRVTLRFRTASDVIVTDPGSLEISLEVEEDAPTSTLCSSDADCAGDAVCCVSGFLGSCQPLEPGTACAVPDLTVSAELAQQTLLINRESFPPDSCAIEEGCVAGSGSRRLLRFSTMTPNVGDADLMLGDPTSTNGFEFAPCHGHYHFNGYARYELVDDVGAIIAVGHKQAFCLLDSVPLGIPGSPSTRRFHCGFQGLQRGWADIYDSSLDCQWVDITDVPDGNYLLRISINPDRVIEESNYDNNTVELPVSIAPPPPVDPLSPCAAPLLGLQRECGWGFAKGFEGVSCAPGEPVSLGCGCESPLTCGGDPMLRVCEGSAACGAQASLAFVDDTCGLCPQLELTCPASGIYSVLSASFSAGATFVCEVERRLR
jgi:Lysyl oxidase